MAHKDNDDTLQNFDIIDIVDISNNFINNNKRTFLRKGQGKLASQHHGITNYSLNRKNSFVFDQQQNEKNHIKSNIKINNFMKKFQNN